MNKSLIFLYFFCAVNMTGVYAMTDQELALRCNAELESISRTQEVAQYYNPGVLTAISGTIISERAVTISACRTQNQGNHTYESELTQAWNQSFYRDLKHQWHKDLSPIEQVVMKYNPQPAPTPSNKKWSTKTVITSGCVIGLSGVVAGASLAAYYLKSNPKPL